MRSKSHAIQKLRAEPSHAIQKVRVEPGRMLEKLCAVPVHALEELGSELSHVPEDLGSQCRLLDFQSGYALLQALEARIASTLPVENQAGERDANREDADELW